MFFSINVIESCERFCGTFFYIKTKNTNFLLKGCACKFFLFKELIELIEPSITKETTNMRLPIAPDEKLPVTLRLLATGESYESLWYQFRIHRTTIGRFVPLVCQAIYSCLKEKYLKIPRTEEEWKSIADKTFDWWQIGNAAGAMDEKHISLFHPKDSGSEYYNYKGFCSLVMLALVDYDYKFMFIDVGCQGRISDGGVYKNSSLSNAIENNLLNLSPPHPLPISEDPEWIHDHIYIVAGNAFPLKPQIMKPYSPENWMMENFCLIT